MVEEYSRITLSICARLKESMFIAETEQEGKVFLGRAVFLKEARHRASLPALSLTITHKLLIPKGHSY